MTRCCRAVSCSSKPWRAGSNGPAPRPQEKASGSAACNGQRHALDARRCPDALRRPYGKGWRYSWMATARWSRCRPKPSAVGKPLNHGFSAKPGGRHQPRWDVACARAIKNVMCQRTCQAFKRSNEFLNTAYMKFLQTFTDEICSTKATCKLDKGGSPGASTFASEC